MCIDLMGTGAVNGHSRQSTSIGQTTVNFDVHRSSRSELYQDSPIHPSSVPSTSTHTDSRKPNKTMKMSCEKCSVSFTVFRRKKFCQECHRYFCSTCLPKPVQNSQIGRQCSKCRLLMSGDFSRGDLLDWKIKDIRCFLNVRNISTKGCREKHDLIELVLTHFCTARRNSIQEQIEHDFKVREMAARMQNVGRLDCTDHLHNFTGNSENETVEPPEWTEPPADVSQDFSSTAAPEGSRRESPRSSTEGSRPAENGNGIPSAHQSNWQDLLDSMERLQETFNSRVSQQTTVEDPAPSQRNRRTHLDDIKVESDIDSLTVRQLKELLVNNFVDYKGCCEKAELVDRVHRLYRDYLENKSRAEKIHQEEDAEVFEFHQRPPNAGGLVTPPEPPPKTEVVPPATQEESDHPDPPVSSTTVAGSTATTSTASSAVPSSHRSEARMDSLCHVCMDALTDCILLECGHMVTCTTCGKQLADCPICRQYITRVVRVFRS